MALFQRQPINNTQPLYTLDNTSRLLIIGLGNIGKKYDYTRHNIGFLALDYFARTYEFPDWQSKNNLYCDLTTQDFEKAKILLAKPATYMNDSGRAISALQNFFKINNSSTLLVYDDIDIDFGQVRMNIGGSSAGHNGVESVINACGDDFARIRIGIGPKSPGQIDSADYVLQKFSSAEQENIEELYKETADIINEYIFSGGKLSKETRSFLIK